MEVFRRRGWRSLALIGLSGGLSPQSVENDSRQALQVGTDIYVGASVLGITYSEIPIALPLAIIGGAIDFLVNFFEDRLAVAAALRSHASCSTPATRCIL